MPVLASISGGVVVIRSGLGEIWEVAMKRCSSPDIYYIRNDSVVRIATAGRHCN